MKKHFVVVLRLATLLLVFLLVASREIAARELTPAEKAIIVANLGLLDPESARFKWMPFDPHKIHYCASVNAKNAYGGYVGYQLFAIEPVKDRNGRIVDAHSPLIGLVGAAVGFCDF